MGTAVHTVVDRRGPAGPAPGGNRWFVDETYAKISGVWRYDCRAVDRHGQVIDVYVSQRRDVGSARTFFTAAMTVHGNPGEVIADRAPALAKVIEELVPAARHNTGQYEKPRRMRPRPTQGQTPAHAPVEDESHGDRGDPRARLHPELRRGHYELAVDSAQLFRLATAFDELRPTI